MQVPPLETHRRDGLFFKYSTRELSLPSLSRTLHWNSPAISPALWKGETNKIKSDKDFFFFSVSVSLRFNSTDSEKRGSAGEEERVRGTANGNRVGALIESWETARERGESGQQDIERRGNSDGGLAAEEQLSTWAKPAIRQVQYLFLTSPALHTQSNACGVQFSASRHMTVNFEARSRPRPVSESQLVN